VINNSLRKIKRRKTSDQKTCSDRAYKNQKDGKSSVVFSVKIPAQRSPISTNPPPKDPLERAIIFIIIPI